MSESVAFSIPENLKTCPVRIDVDGSQLELVGIIEDGTDYSVSFHNRGDDLSVSVGLRLTRQQCQFLADFFTAAPQPEITST
jgi:hypothetical protein